MANDTMAVNRIWAWVIPARETDWDALYAAELPRVYNFFRYRVGDGAVAEDLTSLTFEKAWRARHRYRRDLAAFSTWLFAIARNVAVDHYRQQRPCVPLDEAGDLPGGDDPEATAERRSDAARLAHLLALLPERERDRKSTRLNSSHLKLSRMPSSA